MPAIKTWILWSCLTLKIRGSITPIKTTIELEARRIRFSIIKKKSQVLIPFQIKNFSWMLIRWKRMTKSQKYFQEKGQMDRSLPELEICCNKKLLFQQSHFRFLLSKESKMNKISPIKIKILIKIWMGNSLRIYNSKILKIRGISKISKWKVQNKPKFNHRKLENKMKSKLKMEAKLLKNKIFQYKLEIKKSKKKS